MHLGLLISFVYMKSEPEPLNAGFVEVEFGPFQAGRPVQRTEQAEPEVEEPAEDPQPEEATPVQQAPEETKPVDLPDQVEPVVEEEVVQTPETETVAPEEATAEEEDVIPTQTTAAEGSEGGGQPQGETGETTGQEGEGTEEVKAAPYVLEGIDRTPIRTPLPAYADKVNAVIQVRITVDPRGRITRSVPLRKGNAALEQAVMQALRRWQFNALAANVPQENQTGTITFRFRLQ